MSILRCTIGRKGKAEVLEEERAQNLCVAQDVNALFAEQ